MCHSLGIILVHPWPWPFGLEAVADEARLFLKGKRHQRHLVANELAALICLQLKANLFARSSGSRLRNHVTTHEQIPTRQCRSIWLRLCMSRMPRQLVRIAALGLQHSHLLIIK